MVEYEFGKCTDLNKNVLAIDYCYEGEPNDKNCQDRGRQNSVNLLIAIGAVVTHSLFGQMLDIEDEFASKKKKGAEGDIFTTLHKCGFQEQLLQNPNNKQHIMKAGKERKIQIRIE